MRQSGPVRISSIVTYPVTVLKECGHSLNTKQDKELARTAPTFASLSMPNISNSAIQIPVKAYSESIGRQTGLINRYRDTTQLITVDDNLGEVWSLGDDGVLLVSVAHLQPLHPKNYPILPTEILSFFATGVISNIKHQAINHVIVRALGSGSIPMEQVMAIFGFDNKKLLEYCLSLLVFLEPVHVHLI